MNALQNFIATVNQRSYGFLMESDIPGLIQLDRLCQVLVRCGGCRFTCAAQDVTHLIKCVEAGGDYVRDVSFPVGAMERAASWRLEPTQEQIAAMTLAAYGAPKSVIKSALRTPSQTLAAWFDENDCGGVFDGHQVTSDADPGL